MVPCSLPAVSYPSVLLCFCIRINRLYTNEEIQRYRARARKRDREHSVLDTIRELKEEGEGVSGWRRRRRRRRGDAAAGGWGCNRLYRGGGWSARKRGCEASRLDAGRRKKSPDRSAIYGLRRRQEVRRRRERPTETAGDRGVGDRERESESSILETLHCILK